MLVAILVLVWCRSNNAATIATTVPLSVCYRGLNLLVLADTSNFVPYVCDLAIAGGVRGTGKHRTVIRYFRW